MAAIISKINFSRILNVISLHHRLPSCLFSALPAMLQEHMKLTISMPICEMEKAQRQFQQDDKWWDPKSQLQPLCETSQVISPFYRQETKEERTSQTCPKSYSSKTWCLFWACLDEMRCQCLETYEDSHMLRHYLYYSTWHSLSIHVVNIPKHASARNDWLPESLENTQIPPLPPSPCYEVSWNFRLQLPRTSLSLLHSEGNSLRIPYFLSEKR